MGVMKYLVFLIVFVLILFLIVILIYNSNYNDSKFEEVENKEGVENKKDVFSERMDINFDVSKYPALPDERDEGDEVFEDTCVACAGGDRFIAYYSGKYNRNLNTTVAYDRSSTCGCGRYWANDGHFVYVNKEFKEVSEEGFLDYMELYNSSCNGCLEQYAFYGD